MKHTKTIKTGIFYIILLCIPIISYSCGGYNPDGVTGEGSIAFKIQIQDTQNIANKPQTIDSQLPLMAAIDCTSTGISTVEGIVYDSSGTTLSSGSWSCSAHTGTINNVSAGSNRRVIINGKDSGGIIKYSGEQTGITVTASLTTDAGTITLTATTTTTTTTTTTRTGTTTTTGLVGYWKLNGNANDDSGNGYNGTVTGAVSTTSGKLDMAYSFDGSGDYIDYGNINNFDRTDSFSISAWVKRGATGIPHTIVSRRNDSAGTGYAFYIDSANKLDIIFGKTNVSDSIRLNSALTFTDSNWHHYVITYDGSSSASGVKLYADGVQLSTNTDWNTLSSSFSNSYAFRIGDVSDGGVGMNGIIDEVRIYNRALSASEISDLYNNP